MVPESFRLWADGLDHPEGVAAGPDGRTYAGGEAGQIYAIADDGSSAVIAETGGFALGLALDAQGRIYVCDLGQKAVLRVDPASGSRDVYSSGSADVPMRTPNYPAFDAAGNLYVTDSGDWQAANGLVYRIAPGGQTEVWSRSVTEFPNGCCMSSDGKALYVVESNRPGVSRIAIRPDGSAGETDVILSLPPTDVPDGVAVASDGSLIVSCYRPDRIYRLTADAHLEILGDDPFGVMLSAPTNIAFVGPQRDKLAVSSLGRYHLLLGDIGVAGLALHFPTLP